MTSELEIACNKALTDKINSSNPPTQNAINTFKKELLKPSYLDHSGLSTLISICSKNNLTPYIKKHGPKVKNKHYSQGDLIGLYFTDKKMTNGDTASGSKFFGIDITKPTINLQHFGTDSCHDPIITYLANKYNLIDSIDDGSLRIHITDERVNSIIFEFILRCKYSNTL